MNGFQRLQGGLVFGLWALTLTYILATDRVRLFLRPEFAWLVGIGAVIAVAFMIGSLRHPVRVPTLRLLILLLPLIHILSTDGGLGHDVFSNRFLGVDLTEKLPIADPLQPPPPDTDNIGNADGPDRIMAAEAEPDDVVPDQIINQGFTGVEDPIFRPDLPKTIVDLLREPHSYQGQTVEILGQIQQDQELSKHFGPGRTVALYRFVLVCCAADALPVTVALDNAPPADWQPQQWARVHGRFELEMVNGKTVPLIRQARITPTAPPPDPYLY